MFFLTVEIAITSILVGLIWVIQWVHYPSFIFIERTQFHDAHMQHMRRITHIVMPLMLLEVFCVGGMIWMDRQLGLSIAHIMAACLLFVVWGSTWIWQVPLHQKLAHGYDETCIGRLVASNWIRTVAWSARFLLLLYATSA